MLERKQRANAALHGILDCPREGQGWDRQALAAVANAIEVMDREHPYAGNQTRWLLSWAEVQMRAILATED
jgi:hypothetical protein